LNGTAEQPAGDHSLLPATELLADNDSNLAAVVKLVSEHSFGTSWASDTAYFCAIGMAVLLAWRFVGVMTSSILAAPQIYRVLFPKSSSSDGFSSDRWMHHWLRLRRRVLKIDQKPLLEGFGGEEVP